MLSGIELTAPALLLAGVAASPHCALMCGAMAGMVGRGQGADRTADVNAALLANGGRVVGYALLGAVAGLLGGMLFAQLPAVALGDALRLLAAGALIAIGVMHWRGVRPRCHISVHQAPGAASMLARGLAWSLIPCPMLYAVLALCAFSGSMATGAMLAAAFGIGTMPAMTTAVYGARWFSAPQLRAAGGGVMLGLGGITILAVLLPGVAAVVPWCSPG